MKDKDKDKRFRVCPACNGQKVERISRGTILKTLLFWLPVQKYYCFKCFRTFYRFGK
ncbi:hypothetical protein [Hufsiella ginkgonis]|uniref:Uncharacterized protein n=1 Tax=Hufsiella ginkgonis TaxID=2695274 RepID=A0A7K1XYS8_9SPHI|nr:hypothetical protein [Hufsiella ginkgonis]MXV16102.1 hypothetical protein [Hufsiella ginkgonis]